MDGEQNREGESRKPASQSFEESDEVMVPEKSPKTRVTPVEEMEGRASAKGKSAARNASSTQGEQEVLTTLQRIGKRAKERPEEKLTNLLSHIKAPLLREAYQRLKESAVPGVDGVTWAEYGERLGERLLDLQDRIHRGSYHPLPVRRVHIPKGDGRTRPIGIPALEDKVVQQAVRMVLEPIYEAMFIGFSYGFRPGRSQHDALDALAVAIEKKVSWVLDADIQSFLDASSYCTLVCCNVIEQARHCVGELDSQPFSASLPDVDGVELATLYTLQDGLTADAQGERGFEHRNVTRRRLVDEARAQLIGDANAPRGAWCELLAGNEAVVEPAMHGGGRDAENLCSTIDGDDLAGLLRLGRLEARNVPVNAQAAHSVGGEAHTLGGDLALAIEDAGDDGIGIVTSEAAHQFDGILVGTNRRRLGARQVHIELGDEATAPTQEQVCIFYLAVDVNDDFFNQCTEKLFTVTIGGRWRSPYELDIFAEGEDLCTLLGIQDASFICLAPRQIGFSRLKLAQAFLPFSFEAARHQAVVGINGAIASLGTLRLVSCTLDLELDLSEDSVLIALDLLGGYQRRFEASGSERMQKGACNSHVDLFSTDAHAVLRPSVGNGVASAVISRRGEPAVVRDAELAATTAAARQSLEQRGALSHSASGLMRGWARVALDPLLVGFERWPVDVPFVVIADEDRPLGLRTLADPFSYIAVTIDETLELGLAIDVSARIDGVGQHLVNLGVAGHDPADIVALVLPRGKQQPLGAKVQPDTSRRSHFCEAIKDSLDSASNSLIGSRKDLTIDLAEDQTDRQTSPQLAALGLVANATIESSAKHMQLGFGHCALQTEHESIVEQAGMIDTVGVADERVGYAAQIEQSIPVGVVAREPRDFQAEHDADAPERHLRGHVSEAGSLLETRARDPKILVDDVDLIASPAERDRAFDESVLPVRRLAVALDLRSGRLSHVDEGVAGQVSGRDFRRLSHDRPPFAFWLRLIGRLPRLSWRAAGRERRVSRFAALHRVSSRHPGSIRFGSTALVRSSTAAAFGSTSGCLARALSALWIRASSGATTARACNNSETEASVAAI
ncbi:MAG TPA: reverse transcriptase domain-containing protein [Polyangiaceae bacterium]|nr:reverse transcriptase domain-containing protein [Polyangiaceae bacterium]